MNWENMGKQFPMAFKESEKRVSPSSPRNLFREPTLNKYHVDSAKNIGEMFNDYIDSICEAICDAISKWMNMASVASLIINGPVGSILPCGVIGPSLTPLIMARAPNNTLWNMKYSSAIANAFGTQWQGWHMGLTGTIMYPSFESFPGSTAPPTPNEPVPLMTLSSPGEVGLSPEALKQMMEKNLGHSHALHSSDLFDSIARAFNTVFQIFKASTLVTNVLGTGPVPLFAPPASSAGAVLMGSSVPTPGVFK